MEDILLNSIVANFTKAIIEELRDLLGTGYDSVYDEAKQFVDRDLKKYLTKQNSKYSHIKTLLRGNMPVYLYEIYYPLKLLKVVRNKEEIVHTESVKSLFKHKNYITIIGDAGSGKSTLIKHLFLNCIKENLGIPILIELRYLNNSKGQLEEYIRTAINQNRIAVNKDILNRFLDKGKFVFFLDGYDELDTKSKELLSKNLMDFINEYSENKFILTTRPYSNIEHLPLFLNLVMKDLSLRDGEIEEFVIKQLASELELAGKINQSINQNQSRYIHSFLKNPLLLSLYILTYQSNASIPDKKHIFYGRVINALFSEHDSKSKLGFVREKTCGLNQEDFELVLKIFSYLSYFESKFSFDRIYVSSKLKIIKEKYPHLKFSDNTLIQDLKSAISLWTDDDGELSFAHRSLQEYYVALFIKGLNIQDESKRVYNKITSKYIVTHGPLREIENLLTLLEEMDSLNYNRFFYLPILKELLERIDCVDIEKTMESFILFLALGFSFNDKKPSKGHESIHIIINAEVYKTFIIHKDFTRNLFIHLKQKLNENFELLMNSDLRYVDEIDVPTGPEVRIGGAFNVLFGDQLQDVFKLVLLDTKTRKITEEYKNFVNQEISTAHNFISNSGQIEKGLIDLI